MATEESAWAVLYTELPFSGEAYGLLTLALSLETFQLLTLSGCKQQQSCGRLLNVENE